MLRFKDKVAIVTGGGHGIGRAIALRLASEGAAIAVLDIARADEVTAELRALGARAIAANCDVTDIESVNAAVRSVGSGLGAIDVLINNAGYLRGAGAMNLEWDEWRRAFAVNVDGMLATIKAVLPGMIERRSGAIVNIASVGALFGASELLAYSASKGAVVNMTRQIATDYRRQGVRVNCVCPGMVPTGFNDPVLKGVTDEQLAAIIDRGVPAGRQGEPSEIAAVVAFLASEDASYVSGQVIVADGGWTASL